MSSETRRFDLSTSTRRLDVRLLNFPEDLGRRFRDDLARLAWVVPSWATEIEAHYLDAGEGDTVASVSVHVRYRQAAIDLHPCYFRTSWDTRRRREALLHELLHVTIAPLADRARDLLEDMTEPGTIVRRVTTAALEDQAEGVVQDLARAIIRNPAIVKALGLDETT